MACQKTDVIRSVHDQLDHSFDRRCVKMLGVAIVVGRCGDYNKVRIRVSSME